MTDQPGDIRSVTKKVSEAGIDSISYMVIKTKDPDYDCEFGYIYSILCIMKDSLGGIETGFYYDVTRVEKTATDLLSLLSDNLATPGSIEYILSDIL